MIYVPIILSVLVGALYFEESLLCSTTVLQDKNFFGVCSIQYAICIHNYLLLIVRMLLYEYFVPCV